MLFPITIFPCVPFASAVFLINGSAETESSCPDSVLPAVRFWDRGSGTGTQSAAAHFAFLGASYGVPTSRALTAMLPAGGPGPPVSRRITRSWSCFSPRPSALEKERRQATLVVSGPKYQVSGPMTPLHWFPKLVGLWNHLSRAQGQPRKSITQRGRCGERCQE